MKKHKKHLLTAAFLLTAFLAVNTFAGDFAFFKFNGFSKDGKYLAFEETGSYDGSGGYYTHTFFIDTAKNEFALPPTLIDNFDAENPIPQRAQTALERKTKLLTAANLRKLRIVANNTGELLVAHLPNDWTDNPFTTVYGETEETIRFHNAIYANVPNGEYYYELKFKSSLIKDENCPSEAYKFDLTLTDKSSYDVDAPLQILQSDKSLPKRRGCPYGYRVERVYLYEDRVAVFLQVFSQGFEGPDLRYMVVTGKLAVKPKNKDTMSY